MQPPADIPDVGPRLRIEPCPTFYLRTARAYAFLQNFLVATAGKGRLSKLHGLAQGGYRQPSLADELEAIRQRFYGFYLVSCEDIGMKPQLLADEPVDREVSKTAALEWLKDLAQNADLACDTRVSLPIYRDDIARRTRSWATLGVRLARLDADYARPPKAPPKEIRRQLDGGAKRSISRRPSTSSPGRVRRVRASRPGHPEPRRSAPYATAAEPRKRS